MAGVVMVGFVFFQSANATAYACGSLLSPAPNQATDPSKPGFSTQFQGNQHVPVGTTISFGFCPPTSGNHYNSPPRGPIPAALYGVGTEEPPGGWVHNLEHGYVVMVYRCPSGVVDKGDCVTSGDMALMQQWINDAPVDPACRGIKAIVVRFDSMTTRFGVLAWNRALLLDDLAPNNLTLASNFRDAFTNTTAPEPNNC